MLQQELKGLVNQIDAHHREDDRRERSQGRNDAMEGVFVEEADSGEEVGVQAEGGKKRKVGKGKFGGGSGSAIGITPAQLLELLRGMSEEDQNTFKHNRDRMEVTTCPLWRVTILKLVFVQKIRLKRRVFKVFKVGKKFLRSGFFLLAQEQGKMDFFK